MAFPLSDLATIATMQRSLKRLDGRQLGARDHRETVYALADIPIGDIERFDAAAIETERLRRSIFGQDEIGQ